MEGVDEQGLATPTALKPYEDAAKTYLTNAGRLLGSIRAEIGGAVRLVPFDQWTKLKALFYQELLRLDLEVTKLVMQGPDRGNSQDWLRVQSYVLQDLAAVLDDTIDGLAAALSLKYRGNSPDEGAPAVNTR